MALHLRGARPARGVALIALCVPLFMTMLDGTAVNVALASIERTLGASVSQLQWIVNVYTLVWAVAMLSGGGLADRYGRRRILLCGMGLFTLASVLSGVAEAPWMLIMARAVQGIGAALMIPASLAMIAQVFPAEERGAAIGVWAGTSAVALACGPIVGGALTQGGGWRWIFYVNVPVALIGGAVARAHLPESRDVAHARRLDAPGVAMSGLGLFALTFALIEVRHYGWTSAQIVGLFGGAVLALVAFVLLERRVSAPMVDLALFRSRMFRGANATGFLVTTAAFGTLFVMSLYLQQARHFGPLETGIVFLPWTAAYVILAPIAGRLADRVGARWVVVGGMVAIATGLVALSTVRPDTGIGAVLLGLFVAGTGVAFVLSPNTAAGLSTVPANKVGIGSALINTFRQVGTVLAVALLGTILESVRMGAVASGKPPAAAYAMGMSSAFHVTAGIALLGAVIAGSTLRAERRDTVLAARV